MSEGPVKKKIIVKKKVDSATTDSEPNRKIEEDADRKAEEEAREAEAAKKAALEEATKKAALEEAAKKVALEEAAKKAALEEETKKAALEEAAKKAALDAEKIHKDEEAAKKAVLEAEKIRKDEEEAKKAALEAEKIRKDEEEAKKAALEAAKKAALEEAAKKAALEEAAKKVTLEEEAKKAALDAAKKAALEEAAKKAALEAEEEARFEIIAKKLHEMEEAKKDIEAPKEVSNGIADRYNFKDGHWEDKGTYYLNNYDQGTDGWKNARFRRLTASNFGYAAGFGTFENSAPLDIALDITRIKTKVFSEESIGYMAHGTKTEPKVREWYSKLIGKPITEVGLAVPKWEIRIGGSLDGDIENTDECIEIKCPKAMYGPLVKHIERTKDGWKPPRFYHDHIWKSHYAQMQGCMKITNKKWCHYIVFDATNEKVFFEKIEFNESYWENELYPKIKDFLDNMLEPLLRDGINSPLIAHLNLGDR